MDKLDLFSIFYILIVIAFTVLILVLVAFIGVDLRTDADAKQKCYELTYEEYKLDTRCQELLEE